MFILYFIYVFHNTHKFSYALILTKKITYSTYFSQKNIFNDMLHVFVMKLF